MGSAVEFFAIPIIIVFSAILFSLGSYSADRLRGIESSLEAITDELRRIADEARRARKGHKSSSGPDAGSVP